MGCDAKNISCRCFNPEVCIYIYIIYITYIIYNICIMVPFQTFFECYGCVVSFVSPVLNGHKSLTKSIHFEIPGTDVQFGRKLKLLEETLDEILNVCDVIGTEQRSMKVKMTSLQVQMDSAGVSRPGKCRMSVVSFLNGI